MRSERKGRGCRVVAIALQYVRLFASKRHCLQLVEDVSERVRYEFCRIAPLRRMLRYDQAQ